MTEAEILTIKDFEWGVAKGFFCKPVSEIIEKYGLTSNESAEAIKVWGKCFVEAFEATLAVADLPEEYVDEVNLNFAEQFADTPDYTKYIGDLGKNDAEVTELETNIEEVIIAGEQLDIVTLEAE